jgi:multidrug efflux pump subunit AcrA (membrane-fusion protein)
MRGDKAAKAAKAAKEERELEALRANLAASKATILEQERKLKEEEQRSRAAEEAAAQAEKATAQAERETEQLKKAVQAERETEQLKKAASDTADSGSYTSHMTGGMPGGNDGGSIGSRTSTKMYGKDGALMAAAGGLLDGDFSLHQAPLDLVQQKILSQIVVLRHTAQRVHPICTDGFQARGSYKESTFSPVTKQMEKEKPKNVPEEERPAYWERVRNLFRMNYNAVEQEKEQQKKEKPHRYGDIQTVDGLAGVFGPGLAMDRD